MKCSAKSITAFTTWLFLSRVDSYINLRSPSYKRIERRLSINSSREWQIFSSDKSSPSLAEEDEIPTTSFKARFIDVAPKSPLDKPQIIVPGAKTPNDFDYSTNGPLPTVDFVLTREGPAVAEELADENLLKMIRQECTDLEVNTLVWKCLGYRHEVDVTGESPRWGNKECFPNWSSRYPVPPDFLGMKRVYSKDVDEPSLRSNQALVRTIPLSNKQQLKVHLKKYGFRGFKLQELTPNKTRRAQCANWLLYYREEIFGYSLKELQVRKKERLKKEKEESERNRTTGTNDNWRPPLDEVV